MTRQGNGEGRWIFTGLRRLQHFHALDMKDGNRNGQVHCELKTPWRNGTTHVIFKPFDFKSRLVGLVPKPKVNLTRFHGVLMRLECPLLAEMRTNRL